MFLQHIENFSGKPGIRYVIKGERHLFDPWSACAKRVRYFLSNWLKDGASSDALL